MSNNRQGTALLEDSDEVYRALNSTSCPALTENREQDSVSYKVNDSCVDASCISKSAPDRKVSGLGASLYGLPSVSRSAGFWVFVASSGYYQFKRHHDSELKQLVIRSAREDFQKVHGIVNEFDGPIERCYYFDNNAKYPPATTSNVLEGLGQRSNEMPGFIYIALHRSSEETGFMAADYPKESCASSDYVIRDAEIRSTILASLKPGTKPLFLLTEACHTDNIMELPYFLECDNGIITRHEVECKKHDWNSRPPMIHMSATIPKHKAVHLNAGAVFTQAFNNQFKQPIKVEDLVKVLQAAVDKQLRKISTGDAEGNPLQQQIRLYYSTPEALQADTLWSFVGLELKPHNQEAV